MTHTGPEHRGSDTFKQIDAFGEGISTSKDQGKLENYP